MESTDGIIEKVLSNKDENIIVNLKGLMDAVTLEKALNERGIPFVMDIRLTNEGCIATISRRKLDIYEKNMQDFYVEEPKVLYETEILKEKRVPIGISNYRDVINENAYCVDKTKMIEELLTLNDEVTLITRPRRFGKTLNMSMLAEFFDITKESKELFKNTYIYHTKYVKEMNQWPVIFMTLKDCKGKKEKLIKQLYMELSKEYGRYYDEFQSVKDRFLSNQLLEICDVLLDADISINGEVTVINAIELLMRFLYKKYEKRVILLVDEYDTPFMSAYAGKYSEQVKDLLTGMFSSALKDNEYLYKGVLTGIQRIAKENLFSGLNNLEVCSIQDEKYKDVFGFTEDETRTLLEAHHLELNQDVKEMYDGYTIGGIEIYNPWSVINYADKGVLASYWINTGSNEVVCQLLEKSSNKVKKQYIELLEKGEMKVNCILEGAYIELRGATQLWALLVHAGYLTIKAKVSFDEYVLRIVNGEVKQDLIQILKRIFSLDDCNVYEMFEMIQEGKIKEFEEAYQEILFNYPSYFDLKDENSYHVLMLGLCIIVSDSYEIMSNQEKGYGRADIYLKSKKGQRDIVIEMKYAENDKEDCLLASADKAMTQILDKHYGDDAIKIGIGNHQKKAKMAWKI